MTNFKLVNSALPLQEFGAVGRRARLRRRCATGRCRPYRPSSLRLVASLSQLKAAPESAARFGFGLEGFPDHRRFGIDCCRETSEHPLSGRAVDPDHADARRSNERDFWHIAECNLCKLLEDRRSDTPALRSMAHRPWLIISDVYAGDHF